MNESKEIIELEEMDITDIYRAISAIVGYQGIYARPNNLRFSGMFFK
jgi:hypothetical protein